MEPEPEVGSKRKLEYNFVLVTSIFIQKIKSVTIIVMFLIDVESFWKSFKKEKRAITQQKNLNKKSKK